MKKLIVLTGAGISAESGLATFRDSGGLWEGHKVEDVATPEGWERNPALVLDFYNERRKSALKAKPNQAHIILAELEKKFDLIIITQNGMEFSAWLVASTLIKAAKNNLSTRQANTKSNIKITTSP